MKLRIPLFLGAVALGALAACADPSELHDEQVEGLQQGLSVCDETVPPARFIDGFPAYAQCPEFANSAIYSNNGVDTSATKLGNDWVRTQYSGGYQCTELATRYFHFKWGVDYVPRGDAGAWCDSTPPANSGVVKTTTPVHGDLMVLVAGSCGAFSTGHVNVVDTVDLGSGKLVAVEQNMARRGTYRISCAKCFLHAVVNDGSAPADAGTSPPVDAGRRDAGRPEPEPDEEEEEEEEEEEDTDRPDAGRNQDADDSSSDDEDEATDEADQDPNVSPAVAAEGGCSVSTSGPSQLMAYALLLASFALLRRRRRRAPTVRR